MAHWHAQLPGRILDVHYEDLVAEPERVAREVLAFCGLPWRTRLVDDRPAQRPGRHRQRRAGARTDPSAQYRPVEALRAAARTVAPALA